MAGKELSVEAINRRLKAGRVGVTVLQRGEKLSLRATLPPKPGSGKAKPCYQNISLGVYANPAGLNRAETEAKKLGVLLAEEKFDWDLYLAIEEEGDRVREWMERFKAHAITNLSKAEISEEGVERLWERRYWNLGLKLLPAEAVLTPELLIQSVQKKKANTRSRQLCCQVLGQFAKFAGVAVDLSIYSGNYSPYKSQKNLPSDIEIEHAIDEFKNPQWQQVAGLMAVYGLRDHECFMCRTEWRNGILVIKVEDGKTGEREVYPCPPEWAVRWHLEHLNLPKLQVRIREEYGERVPRAFKRQNCSFTPYTLRHAWAIRVSVAMGLPISAAAALMGHSPTVHLKTYNRHLSQKQIQSAYESAISDARVVRSSAAGTSRYETDSEEP